MLFAVDSHGMGSWGKQIRAEAKTYLTPSWFRCEPQVPVERSKLKIVKKNFDRHNDHKPCLSNRFGFHKLHRHAVLSLPLRHAPSQKHLVKFAKAHLWREKPGPVRGVCASSPPT